MFGVKGLFLQPKQKSASTLRFKLAKVNRFVHYREDQGMIKCMIAFQDPEQRYRQRYVDLTVNPRKRRFIKRTLW